MSTPETNVVKARVHAGARRRVAENLERLLAAKAMMMSELARRSGVARSVLYELRDATMGASVDVLGRVADALRCDPSELLRPITSGRGRRLAGTTARARSRSGPGDGS